MRGVLTAIGPPLVVGGNHHGSVLLGIQVQTTESESSAIVVEDLLPDTGLDVVLVDISVTTTVGVGIVDIRDVESLLSGGESSGMGEEAGGLAGDSSPGGTRVGGHVDGVGSISSSDEDSGGTSRGAGGAVKGDKGQTDDVSVLTGITRLDDVCSWTLHVSTNHPPFL